MERGRGLRVLHLLSQRPDSTGSGIYLQAMLTEAGARGHTSFVVAGVPSDEEPDLEFVAPDRSQFVRFSGPDLPHPIVGMSDVMPYESVRWHDLSADAIDAYEAAFADQILGAASSFAPDLIHTHHLWIMSSLVRRLLPDLPVIATCHGSDLRQFQSCPHLRDRVLSGCAHLDAVTALSRAQRADILDLYGLPPERVSVVGAGYDDARFAPESKPEPNPVRLVYAGKLSRAKGVPWLLRALATIDAPPWHLDLVGGGGGEEAEECLRLAKDLGARVTAHGAIPQGDLASIMKRSHVFVLPSFFEGLGLVVLEALASGCRVVATDLAGIEELLGRDPPECAELVTLPRLHAVDRPVPEDEAAFEQRLADALRRQILAAVEEPEIDAAPLAEILRGYSWTGVFERVEAVYRGALGERAARPDG